MKKITFLLALGLFFFVNQLTAQIRIVKADTSNGEVTIKNFGGGTVDISSYRLCASFNYSPFATGLTSHPLVSGSLNLTSGAEVVVDWSSILTIAAIVTDSDLGLYVSTTDFTAVADMVDFTQWGAGGGARENVAVAKGIWTAGQFITVDGSAYVYTGDGSENGNTFWTTEDILGIEKNVFFKNLKVHPNPTTNQFSITTNTVLNSVRIINLTGQLVKEVNHGLNEIDVSDLSNGLYLIELTSNNQKGVKRLVIQ